MIDFRPLQLAVGVKTDNKPGPITWGAVAKRLDPDAPDTTGAALAMHMPVESRAGIISFLANIVAEGGFVPREEDLDYRAARLVEVFPGRIDLRLAPFYARQPEKLANFVYGGRYGNHDPGDGWKYRGRGWPQITFHDGYAAVGFLDNPDDLLTVEGSAIASARFWAVKKLQSIVDERGVLASRRPWNGGTNGMADYARAVARLTAWWL